MKEALLVGHEGQETSENNNHTERGGKNIKIRSKSLRLVREDKEGKQK